MNTQFPTIITVVMGGVSLSLWNPEDSSHSQAKLSSLQHVSLGPHADPGSRAPSLRAWLTLGSRPALIRIATCQNRTWDKSWSTGHSYPPPFDFLTCSQNEQTERILFLLIHIGHHGRADGAGELSNSRTQSTTCFQKQTALLGRFSLIGLTEIEVEFREIVFLAVNKLAISLELNCK